MQYDHPAGRSEDPRTDLPSGLEGRISGMLGERDHHVQMTGGWASDTRSILARVRDVLGFYLIVGALLFAVMVLITLFLRI